MIFLHPEFLFYMLPPVVIFFYFILTQQEKQFGFFADDVLKKLRLIDDVMSLRGRNLLFLVSILFIMIALAQPVIEEGKIKVESKSADIMIALDISDSMLAEDIHPNRLKSAKQKVLDLLALAPSERLGIIGFAKNAYLVAPLSFDHKALSFLLRQLKPDSITEQGTDFEQLIRSATEMLAENEQKYLLILTDGGDDKDFSKEIELARKADMKVFVLGMGTTKGAPIKKRDGEHSDYIKHNGKIIVSKLNESIKELAKQSGGAYVKSVSSSADIKAMLNEIESRSDKKSLKEDEITQYIQLFIYPLMVALFFLLLATSSLYKKVNKNSVAAFLIMITFMVPQESRAALLDFQLLDEAKEAYNTQNYEKSAELYSDYSVRHKDHDALYDYANSLYKDKKYKEAEDVYKKIIPKDDTQKFNIKHNLGNSFAKQGDKESLQKAIKSYEEALKISDNKQTKENLEAVKKAIKEQEKKEQQQKDNKKNRDDKDKKEKSDKNKDKKNQKSDKEKSEDKKSDQDKKNKDDSKKEKSDKDKKDQQKSDKQKEQDEKKEADKKKEDEQKKEDKKKDEQQKADKAKDEKEQLDKEKSAQDLEDPTKMSERESKKWLQKIQKNRPGMMYKLKTVPTQHKEDSNAKPW